MAEFWPSLVRLFFGEHTSVCDANASRVFVGDPTSVGEFPSGSSRRGVPVGEFPSGNPRRGIPVGESPSGRACLGTPVGEFRQGIPSGKSRRGSPVGSPPVPSDPSGALRPCRIRREPCGPVSTGKGLGWRVQAFGWHRCMLASSRDVACQVDTCAGIARPTCRMVGEFTNSLRDAIVARHS